MKRLLTCLSLCVITLITANNILYGQTYDWVKGGGTSASIAVGDPGVWKPEGTYMMCTDFNGNTYALSEVGNSSIVADTFNRPTGAYGANANILLTSYNCAGQMRWAKLIASSGGQCNPYSVVTDASGHVYVGAFLTNGTLHIGYDTSITGLVYQSEGLIQFDTSGTFKWIVYVGDNTLSTLSGALSYGSFLAVDGSDNIHFINSTKYGVHITPTLTSHWGTYDIAYNSVGAMLSVNKLQLDSSLFVNGVALDKSSNKLYVYGNRNTAMFPDSSGYIYIAALDASRNLIWKDTLSDPPYEGTESFEGILVDEIGHIYAAAGGVTSVIYQGDTIRNIVTTGAVSFLMKLDTNSHIMHVTKYGGTTSVNVFYSMTLMPNNKIAMAGIMTATVVGSSDTISVYSGEGQNSYFTILDSAGYIHTIQQIHGTGFYDRANAITCDRVGNLYIGGQVAIDTWGGSLTPYTSLGGFSDFYQMKYGIDCGCTSMPVANYTQTGTITRSFTYTGTTAGIDSVRWDFGDGTTSTTLSPTPGPIHTYLTPGTFTACVTVYTGCGSDMHCSDFTITCIAAPTATYAASGTGLTKTYTYTGAGLGPLGTISWDFGDGSSGSGSPVSHTYSAAGTYVICVTATNPCGTNTSCSSVTVTCTSLPLSSFSLSSAGLTDNFTYTGTTAGLDSVTWTFGDGGTANSTAPTHTFSAAGTYTVCATAHTNCGTNTHCTSVVVTCSAAPIASYTFTSVGLTDNFTYTGTSTSLDSVRWNFGDGGTSVSLTPSHTFSAAGTYTVCVTCYTNCGSNTHCSSVTVACISAPVSAFTFSGTSAAISFTYSGTTAGIDSVTWTFGDGGTASGTSPTHTYLTDGTYTVCATVHSNCGVNTVCHNVVVACTGIILASFSDTGHMVHGFVYTGTTSGIDSVVWNFGDGHRDTGIVVLHTYAVADTYHVCVIVYTICGSDTVCADKIITHAAFVSSLSFEDVKVFPNPVTDELYITGITGLMNYRMLNATGITLIHGVLQKGTNTLLIHQLISGIYVLEMTDSDGQKNMVRIVKE